MDSPVPFRSAIPSTSTTSLVCFPCCPSNHSKLIRLQVNFFQALNMLGIPTEFDPQDGTTAGAAFCPADINPKNQTRCDARRAYFDPYVGRKNFHVITGQHVTRVLIENFETNARAGIPTSGGSDGTGSARAPAQPLFDFNPTATSPASMAKMFRRQATSKFRITGVEVSEYFILA